MTDPRRKLPSVSTLLEREPIRALLDRAPRALVVNAVRATIDAARSRGDAPASDQEWVSAVSAVLAETQQPSLRRVINATGVVLHTNLGRAPLAAAAIDAIRTAAAGYTNLEYDIDRGERGSRYAHCVSLLRELTDAEDAVVVNNNAAALVVALNTLASGRDAIISRGELVEIGGSFRIPDIMERSGARLVEVGTTNRTHLKDYETAVTANTRVIMKVHRSNFAMEGYVSDVETRSLVELGRSRGTAVIHDLGSGLLISLDDLGLTGEPTARDAVKSGATLVTMSGDKLLGGPQAGIIVGATEAVSRIRENPLIRALRVDKLTLAALEATLALYRDPQKARVNIPVLAMLGASVNDLRARANKLRMRLDNAASVVESNGSVGGGAFPNAKLPSVALAFSHGATQLEERLRLGETPVIGRVADNRLLLDMRTVMPDEDDLLAAALRAALPSSP